jgi:hypothetical protein
LQVIRTTGNKQLREQAALSLMQFGQGNLIAIERLTELLESQVKNTHILLVAADCLGNIAPKNSTVISVLARLTQASDSWTRMYAARSLGTFAPGNEKAIATLLKIIQTPSAEIDYLSVIDSLEQIGRGNSTAIATLVELIENADMNLPNYEYAVKCLGHIAPGNLTTIKVLEQLIEKSKKNQLHYRICWQAKASLMKIKPDHPDAASILRQAIDETIDYQDIRLEIIESALEISPDRPAFDEAAIRLIETAKDKDALLLRLALRATERREFTRPRFGW